MLKSDDLLVFNCDRPDVWQILDAVMSFLPSVIIMEETIATLGQLRDLIYLTRIK